jgi:hypothetical protein
MNFTSRSVTPATETVLRTAGSRSVPCHSYSKRLPSAINWTLAGENLSMRFPRAG